MYNFSDILREQNSRTEDLSILNDAYIFASEQTRDEYVKSGEIIWIDEAGVQINNEYNDSAEQYYLQKYEEYLDEVLNKENAQYSDVELNDFTYVECDNIIDFSENAEVGTKWEDENGIVYYKINNESGDALILHKNEQGAIIVL